MKTLIIGGKRQGEWVTLAAVNGRAPRTWVDLITGDSYRIRYLTWSVQGPLAGHASELFRLPVAVHPSMTGPMEQHLVQAGLMNVIALLHIDEFMRRHAQELPMADPDITVPDTPAELTDGGA